MLPTFLLTIMLIIVNNNNVNNKLLIIIEIRRICLKYTKSITKMNTKIITYNFKVKNQLELLSSRKRQNSY